MHRWVSSLLALPLLLTAPAFAAEGPVTFETHVRPLLKAYCLECHGEGEKLKGGLDLRLARLMHQGGKSGAGFVPGQPEQSLIYQKVSDGAMPPTRKKLTAEQVK